MGFLGIIPKQVTHKLEVESLWLVQELCMPVSELLLYCPVEAFQVTIGLGMTGVVEVVQQVLFAASPGEILFEFMAVIGLNSGYLEWGNTP